jgi:hypothetical protein
MQCIDPKNVKLYIKCILEFNFKFLGNVLMFIIYQIFIKRWFLLKDNLMKFYLLLYYQDDRFHKHSLGSQINSFLANLEKCLFIKSRSLW